MDGLMTWYENFETKVVLLIHHSFQKELYIKNIFHT